MYFIQVYRILAADHHSEASRPLIFQTIFSSRSALSLSCVDIRISSEYCASDSGYVLFRLISPRLVGLDLQIQGYVPADLYGLHWHLASCKLLGPLCQACGGWVQGRPYTVRKKKGPKAVTGVVPFKRYTFVPLSYQYEPFRSGVTTRFWRAGALQSSALTLIKP